MCIGQYTQEQVLHPPCLGHGKVEYSIGCKLHCHCWLPIFNWISLTRMNFSVNLISGLLLLPQDLMMWLCLISEEGNLDQDL